MTKTQRPRSADPVDTEYMRGQYTREPYQTNRLRVLVRDSICQYCQANISATADHVISVYDADSVVGAGMMTVEQARFLVNHLDNLLGACRSCNSSKGDQSPGNKDGYWVPKNPSPFAVSVMRRLGNWEG
jgi:5-methylcytosine-specific restriction endonuclease McrA